VQSVVDEANDLVSQPARIKRFAVLDRDFSMAAGELTPTLKLKRAIAYANHAAMIEELYASR
jgi:long-chain acyl-CoA synthetase